MLLRRKSLLARFLLWLSWLSPCVPIFVAHTRVGTDTRSFVEVGLCKTYVGRDGRPIRWLK